ncbi:hypothetical protein H2136_13525 [Aeromonas hydrophila]|uniref:Uncharacterized protein n=1 Tax=Aeromonas hydrophila TaxID=644 RepID=A0A926FP18_AERHY|nr:hypothetical protein [Aeromonas hydrophila]
MAPLRIGVNNQHSIAIISIPYSRRNLLFYCAYVVKPRTLCRMHKVPKFRRIVKICRISPKFIDPTAQQDKFCRLFFGYGGQAAGKQEAGTRAGAPVCGRQRAANRW